MRTHGWIGRTSERVGLSGVALIILAALTAVLVAVTLLSAPSASEPAAAATRPTQLSTSTPTAVATSGPDVVAFLGDSYASGSGATEPSKRWANLVSLKQNWVIKNLSQYSTSYSTAGEPDGTSYTARLESVVATGAKIVVVSGGRNDVDVSAGQFRADVRATFAGIRLGLPKAKIIVVSPIWDNNTVPARLTAVAAIVKAEAKRAGATYLDIGEPLSGYDSRVTYDGVHPNDAGHAAIAAAVEKALA